MDEIDRSNESPQEQPDAGGAEPREDGAQEGRPPQGGAPAWRGDRDGRRRRGRRGRGGRPPGAFPPPRPLSPAVEEDEGSGQTRELAAYERRQRTQPRSGWRGGAGGARPWTGGGQRAPYGGGGQRAPYTGAGRPPFGGRPPMRGARPQRYQDMIRRATAGPRVGPPEEAGEPIAGPHAVLEALRAGRSIKRVYVAQERGIRTGAASDVIREAQEKRIPVLFVDRMDVQRLSPGVDHQGIVAIAEGRTGVELEELLLHLETLTEPPLVLVIDSLQDPQNFGVLLRSAEGAGADGVVIPRHRQVGLTPAVSRTSAGASEHLLIADVANLRQAIDALKERGIWVIGTDDSGDLDWDAVDYRGATAIVVGGEGEGMRRLVLEGCDQVVRIPMQGKVSSLNAAAAGTIVLFEALRQRLRDAAPGDEPPHSAAEPEAAVPDGDAQSREAAEDAAADETELATELEADLEADEETNPESAPPPRKRSSTKRSTSKAPGRSTAKRTTKRAKERDS